MTLAFFRLAWWLMWPIRYRVMVLTSLPPYCVLTHPLKRMVSRVVSMTNEQWPMTNDQWATTNDQWPMSNDQWAMTNEQWPMSNDQWAMTNEQWPMSNDQWPMTNDQLCGHCEVRRVEEGEVNASPLSNLMAVESRLRKCWSPDALSPSHPGSTHGHS